MPLNKNIIQFTPKILIILFIIDNCLSAYWWANNNLFFSILSFFIYFPVFSWCESIGKENQTIKSLNEILYTLVLLINSILMEYLSFDTQLFLAFVPLMCYGVWCLTFYLRSPPILFGQWQEAYNSGELQAKKEEYAKAVERWSGILPNLTPQDKQYQAILVMMVKMRLKLGQVDEAKKLFSSINLDLLMGFWRGRGKEVERELLESEGKLFEARVSFEDAIDLLNQDSVFYRDAKVHVIDLKNSLHRRKIA